jgi:predicted DNA-binding transcriptional regulator AlpA
MTWQIWLASRAGCNCRRIGSSSKPTLDRFRLYGSVAGGCSTSALCGLYLQNKRHSLPILRGMEGRAMSDATAEAVVCDAPAKRQSRRPAIEHMALSAADVAAMLSISTRQLWSMHASGMLGPVPVSLGERLTRWDAAEVREWWRASKAAGRPITRSEWLAQHREGGALA